MQSYWSGTQEDCWRQLVGLSQRLAAHDPSLSVHQHQGALHEGSGSQSNLTELDWLVHADHVAADARLGCKLHPSDLEACSGDHCSAAAHAAELTEAGADQVSHGRGNLTHGKIWAGMTRLLWFLTASQLTWKSSRQYSETCEAELPL